MANPSELTPLFGGACVRVSVDRSRYETRVADVNRADPNGQDLAVAQFYPSRSHGQGLTGWIISGASSDVLHEYAHAA